MPQAKFSSQYPDVREIFEFALQNGGAKYALASKGKATHWRQRAYTFRTRLRSELGGPTPYDAFTIRVDDCTCFIEVNRPVGALSTLDGSIPVESPLVETDPLVVEAEALRAKLGLKVDL